ncbi:MAG: hypothetical protein N2654_01660 [Deltaproteobacteria bacterium]|nr:hypothetical protein [Deltaproteobacteria bacterium]
MREVNPLVVPIEENSGLLEKIDKDALKIIKRLKKHSYKAYLVGGCVRDLLLGKNPKDFDVVTNAWPKKIRQLFSNSRLIGRRFQLVHVFFGKKIIEVSTFRQEDKSPPEIAKDGSVRKYENKYGNEKTDAFRRDLTINALFMDPFEKKIIDYTGGYYDLMNKKIRVIGNPLTRFSEDPVRVLRTLRHAFRTSFTLLPETVEGIRLCKHLIHDVSPVRLFDELRKDISYGFYDKFAYFLHQHGLLEILFPYLRKATSLESVNYEILSRVSEVDLNKHPHLAVALLWFAFLQNKRGIELPQIPVIHEELCELFGICRPPKGVLMKAGFLLSIFKKTLKSFRKKQPLILKISDDTFYCLTKLVEIVYPEMLNFAHESGRYHSGKDWKSEVKSKATNRP